MEIICLYRLLISGVCGGIIGYERQSRRKIAGLRTHVIVAISSALMILLSKYGFQDVVGQYVNVDPSRVASGVVTAIGFLGSGMIFMRNNNVSGLTTSAGMWATVGVGMAVGAGMYLLGFSATVIVLLVELFLGRRGILSGKGMEMRQITVEYKNNLSERTYTVSELKREIESRGGKVKGVTVKKKEDGGMKVLFQAEAVSGWDLMDFIENVTSRSEVVKVTA